jgi:hypothetical protein
MDWQREALGRDYTGFSLRRLEIALEVLQLSGLSNQGAEIANHVD